MLWDIKDHKENCLLELSLYYRIIHKSLETFLDEILQIIILEIQKKKKNGACVFWAPVFFSKSFGGKIKQMLPRSNYKIAPVFFLAGKCYILNSALHQLFKCPGKTQNNTCWHFASSPHFFADESCWILTRQMLERNVLYLWRKFCYLLAFLVWFILETSEILTKCT